MDYIFKPKPENDSSNNLDSTILLRSADTKNLPQKALTLHFRDKHIEDSFRMSVQANSAHHLTLPHIRDRQKNAFLCLFAVTVSYLVVFIISDGTSQLLIVRSSILASSGIILGLLTYKMCCLFFSYLLFQFSLIICSNLAYYVMEGSTQSLSVSPSIGLLTMIWTSQFFYITGYLKFLLSHGFLLISYIFLQSSFADEFYFTLIESAIMVFVVYTMSRYMFSTEVALRYNFATVHLEQNAEPVTEIEAVYQNLRQITASVGSMMGKVPSKFKTELLGVHEKLLQTRQIMGSNNLYEPRVEVITKDLDEKIFIQENYEREHIRNVHSHTVKPRKTEEFSPRKIYSISEHLGILRNIGKQWNFNTFLLKDCTNGRPLQAIGKYAVQKYGLDEEYGISLPTQENFFLELEGHYRQSNPYHNSTHASDVLNSFLYLVNSSEHCTSIEILASTIAALAHDVGHPGFTNRFLVNSKDPLAMQYNDISVLENMHCSLVFTILKDEENNLLQVFEGQDWVFIRKIMVDLILATDMSKHFELVSQFKTKNLSKKKTEHRLEFYKVALKAADIGHAAKTWSLHKQWSSLVIEEFFLQGDIEKRLRLPVSMFCDRDNTDCNKSQAGFIKNIALPLYEALQVYLDPSDVQICLDELNRNSEKWEGQIHRKMSCADIGVTSWTTRGEFKRSRTDSRLNSNFT